MAIKSFACPKCHASLEFDKTGACRCDRCRQIFPAHHDVIDFRLLSGQEKNQGWDIAEIEKAYREMGDYEDNFAWAAKDGFPREVEEYRHRHLKGRVQEWLSGRSFERVLEIGCGSGYFLFKVNESLRQSAKTLAGLEVSYEQLLKFCARFKRFPQVECLPVLASAESIPLPDSSFDLVVSSEVLEHILHPDIAMREIYRVLKPGGTFCLTTPSHVPTEFWRWFFWPVRVVRRLLQGRSVKDMDKLVVYDQAMNGQQILSYLKSAGFEIVHFERNIFLPHESYFPVFPGWLSQFFLSAGGFLETRAKFLSPLLGLHFVAEVRKPQ